MKRIIPVVFCCLLGIVPAGQAGPRQMSGQPEIPKEKLVNALRLLNTAEYSYMQTNHRFAARAEMLTFLREKDILSKSPIDLENPEPYELAINTSSDGMHYQITLQRPADMNDETTWCSTAAFSDDKGVIFLGQAIDCETAPRLRRIATRHHGFDDATLNDATLNELEVYVAKHSQDLPTVETAFDQKKAGNMTKALEDFWKERGIAVEVRTTITRVAKPPRYAILEFDVYKQ